MAIIANSKNFHDFSQKYFEKVQEKTKKFFTGTRQQKMFYKKKIKYPLNKNSEDWKQKNSE